MVGVKVVPEFVTQYNKKGHDVGQVYSEIMSKTVCKIYKENKNKFTLCKTCIFKSSISIFMNLVSLESLF